MCSSQVYGRGWPRLFLEFDVNFTWTEPSTRLNSYGCMPGWWIEVHGTVIESPIIEFGWKLPRILSANCQHAGINLTNLVNAVLGGGCAVLTTTKEHCPFRRWRTYQVFISNDMSERAEMSLLSLLSRHIARDRPPYMTILTAVAWWNVPVIPWLWPVNMGGLRRGIEAEPWRLRAVTVAEIYTDGLRH